MSENWVRVSEKILEQLKKAEVTTDKDRLELVRSIRYMLNVLQRSLIGWMHWANNPEIMSQYRKELLRLLPSIESLLHGNTVSKTRSNTAS